MSQILYSLVIFLVSINILAGECDDFSRSLSSCMVYNCVQDESVKIRKVLPNYKGSAKTVYRIYGYKKGECQYSLHSASSGKINCSAIRGDLVDVARMHKISLLMESEVVSSINTPALINQIIDKRLKSLKAIFKRKPHLAKKCKPVPNTKDLKLESMIRAAMMKARSKR